MPRELKLDSSTGVHLTNWQNDDWASEFELAQSVAICGDYDKYTKHIDFRLRSKSCARYNCHGMTFAGRRTTIYDADVIKRILKEDEYDIIPQETVQAGDVVIYWAESGDPSHSAIVLAPPDPKSLNVPLVLSKWGLHFEATHRATMCPYDFQRAVYYRVKPE